MLERDKKGLKTKCSSYASRQYPSILKRAQSFDTSRPSLRGSSMLFNVNTGLGGMKRLSVFGIGNTELILQLINIRLVN